MQKKGMPNTIKRINETLIRDKFMERKPLTCASISMETGISITTVRAIMNEMLDRKELISLGLGESSGGRRSEQFIINDNCYQGLSICFTDDCFYVSRTNIHATIMETVEYSHNSLDNIEEILISHIDKHLETTTRAIGIGVPGVVTKSGYILDLRAKKERKIDFVATLTERYSLPIILENDLNASALGYAKIAKTNSTLAFIYLISSCNYIAAGFTEGNKIIRGLGNYAGELGLMPYDNLKDFSEVLYSADEVRKSEILARLVSWVCCTVNPKQVVLCCPDDFKINTRKINKLLEYLLPEKMIPKLVINTEYNRYYLEGMALITSNSIFTN